MSDAYQTWRTDCRPGDVPVLWAPPGLPPLGPLEVPDGWRVANVTRFDDQPYLLDFVAGVAVPADAKPGDYAVTVAGADPITVTVEKPPAQKDPQKLAATADAKKINTALAKGGTVRLAPGYYDLDRDLTPPAAEWAIEGGGLVTLARTRRGPQYGNRVVGLNPGCGPGAVRGVRFANDGGDTLAFHGYPTRLTVQGCEFENCLAIRAGAVEGASVLFRRCVCRWGAGTGEFGLGTWWDRCEFHGGGDGGRPHAYLNGGVDGCLTTSCDWFATARGLVLQNGPKSCATVGCRFFDVDGAQVNGGELLLVEGDGAAGNLFLWNYARNCSGPGISLQGGGIRGNLFQGGRLDCRGLSVHVAQSGPDPITGNTFAEFECDGGIYLAGRVEGNTLAGLVLRDLPASCGNQPPFTGRSGLPDYYAAYRGPGGFPVRDDSQGAGNDWDVAVSGPRGLTRYAGKGARFADVAADVTAV